MSKGLAENTAFQLVLVVMAGGIVMTIMAGPLLSTIEDGFGQLGEMATGNTINVSDRQTLSSAAKYVHARASNDGCADPSDTNKEPTVEGQYPYHGLADTYFGPEPPCIATDDPEGQDMEGTYSRINFIIDETGQPITLGNGSTWLDERVRGATEGDFYERTRGECGQSAVDAGLQAGGAGAAIGMSTGNPVVSLAGGVAGFAAGGLGDKIAGARFVGAKDKYVLFIDSNDASMRTDDLLSNSEVDFSSSIYCYAFTSEVLNQDWRDGDFARSPLYTAYEDDFNENVEIELCPGDRGYIQMNKEKPHNDGEAGENIWGWAYQYPYIQITHTEQESC